MLHGYIFVRHLADKLAKPLISFYSHHTCFIVVLVTKQRRGEVKVCLAHYRPFGVIIHAPCYFLTQLVHGDVAYIVVIIVMSSLAIAVVAVYTPIGYIECLLAYLNCRRIVANKVIYSRPCRSLSSNLEIKMPYPCAISCS